MADSLTAQGCNSTFQSKKRRVAVIVAAALAVVLYLQFMDTVDVHHSGSWWGFSQSDYYTSAPNGQSSLIGRNITVGPVAVDWFYTTTATLTNEAPTNHRTNSHAARK